MAKPAKKAAPEATERKAVGGRPSKLTPELVQEIGERLGAGEPLTAICRDLTERGTPLCDDTVRNWMEKDEELSRDIARAREEGENAIAIRLRKVAAGEKAPEGVPSLSSGDVQRDKLIIETDFKLLAKFNPKRWGDKVQLADADGNKLPPAPQFIVQPAIPVPRPEVDA